MADLTAPKFCPLIKQSCVGSKCMFFATLNSETECMFLRFMIVFCEKAHSFFP